MNFNLTHTTDSTGKTALELLRNFSPSNQGQKLRFNLEGLDVYNITTPFEVAGQTFLAGRVEKREEFLKSLVVFFTPNSEGVWEKVKDAPTFDLEDPFVTKIDGELVMWGVKLLDKSPPVQFQTIFYKGQDIFSLKQFAQGPKQMKDLGLIQLSDQRIGVFTRPQGKKGGKGTVGFIVINSLSELTAEVIEDAPLLLNQFAPDHWGGANEAHLLPNGHLGVLSHYAYDDTDEEGRYRRHYFAATFELNPETLDTTPLKIIATRDNFPEGPAKTYDLHNVIFPGGLIRENGRAYLYAGLSDAEAGVVEIPDPFLQTQID